MSQSPAALAIADEDVKALLACDAHLGDRNVSVGMRDYVFKRRADGVHIIDIRKTWEKIVLAARAIAAVENAKDVCVVTTSAQGATPYAQRASLKAAKYMGSHVIAGKFTPGTFTNYIQKEYYEPRILVVADPRKDHQSVTEASYVNLPVIALCNTESDVRHVDIAIPCNNKGKHSIALIFWLLTREVLRIKGEIPRDQHWDVMVDMFIQPEPEEAEKAAPAPVAAAPAAAAPTETPAYDEAAAGETPAETGETPQ